MKKIILITLALSFCLCGPALCEPIIIANSGVGASVMSAGEIQKIFLGKTVKWNNGEKIMPVALEFGPVHADFLKRYIKKTDTQFSNYWMQMIFTGQGIPPRPMPSEADIVNFVKQTPGSIGYIGRDTPHAGVKVIEVK